MRPFLFGLGAGLGFFAGCVALTASFEMIWKD
jgi:hypothetical protein